MSAETTVAIEDMLAARILGFVPTGGATPQTLGVLLSGGFWWDKPPESPSYPYATGRLSLRNSPGYEGLRKEGTLEVQVWHRPTKQNATAQGLADLIEAALLWFNDAGGATPGGFLIVTGGDRRTLPISNNPAERTLLGLLLQFDVICWPQYLTKYA